MFAPAYVGRKRRAKPSTVFCQFSKHTFPQRLEALEKVTHRIRRKKTRILEQRHNSRMQAALQELGQVQGLPSRSLKNLFAATKPIRNNDCVLISLPHRRHQHALAYCL